MSSPEFSGQVPFFLENFLSRPASALPKGAQWVLVFEGAYSSDSAKKDYAQVLPVDAIRLSLGYEPTQWDIENAINETLHKDYQQTKGCMFVQAVQIPGESGVANPEGLQFNGFIRTMVGGGRNAFENLQISFLETNVSFADNVIRPWVIATNYLGLIARTGKENYRCNISVYKLGVISEQDLPIILQKYTFFGVAPISVTGEEYNYTQTTTPIMREATFIYHYYQLESVKEGTIKASTKIPLSTPEKNVNIYR